MYISKLCKTIMVHPNATEVPPQFPPYYTTTNCRISLLHKPQEIKFHLYHVVSVEGVRHEKNTYGYFNSAFAHISSSHITTTLHHQTADKYYVGRPTVRVGIFNEN